MSRRRPNHKDFGDGPHRRPAPQRQVTFGGSSATEVPQGELHHDRTGRAPRVPRVDSLVARRPAALTKHLYRASLRQDMDAVRRLRAMGASFRGVLLLAATRGDLDLVKALVTRGYPPSHADGSGYTALHYAAARGHADVVRYLLSRPGVGLDAQSTKGETPLALAAKNSHEGVVRLLLRQGADPRIGPPVAGSEAIRELLEDGPVKRQRVG